jgi:phosphatidate cytidylyltransferase
VTGDLDSPKSRSKGLSNLKALFTYDHTGSLKDRLITAFYVLLGAITLSLAALYLPYGRMVCVAFTAAIAAMSIFEVVRLFARDHNTLSYRPLFGVLLYGVLALPSVAASLVAVQSVVSGTIWWQALYAATIISGELLMIVLVIEGRLQLEAAARFGERFGVSFLILGICLPALVLIGGLPHSIQLLWWIAGCVALNDVAAYFAGRSFGAHKMAPGLSPNKSLEGSLAGVVIGTVSGVLLWRLFVGLEQSTWLVAVASSLVVLAAQAGDLAKSYLKRLRGVKDLGAIFPGHGGVLDRFDAMIAAAPVTLVALSLLGMVS